MSRDSLVREVLEKQAQGRFLADRSFCGSAACPCSVDDRQPCDEYKGARHPMGRCAQCGWARTRHPRRRRGAA